MKSSILFTNRKMIQVEFQSCDEVSLKMLKTIKSAQKISFYRIEEVNQEFSQKEMKILCEKLTETLFDFKNILQIYFHLSDYRGVEEGEQLYQNIMRERETQRIFNLIKSGEKVKYSKSKLMFLGNGGVGKTSTLRNLLGESFIKNHVKTKVADCDKNVFCDVHLKNWTKAIKSHDELFPKDLQRMSKILLKEKLFSNIKVQKSEKKTKSVENDISESTLYNVEQLSQFFRNKKDKRRFFLNNRIRIKKENKVERSQTLSIWDFGGQAVYAVLHHLYLTSAGLCIVVFNMKNLFLESKEEEEKSQLKCWLESLNIYAKDNKVFLVGTRCEDKLVRGKHEEVNKMIRKIVKHVCLDDFVKNGKLFFFPVENDTDKYSNKRFHLLPLKKAIMSTLEGSDGLISPWNKKIPLSWLAFMALQTSKGDNIKSLKDIVSKGEKSGFKKKEMKSLLSFFSKAGAILDFSNLSINDVVLRPAFLLKALGRIIYDEKLDDDTLKNIGENQDMTLLSDTYNETGILGSKMLDRVWKTSGLKETEIVFLKNICQKMLIFSVMDEGSFPSKVLGFHKDQVRENDCFYIVPAMSKPQDFLQSYPEFLKDCNNKTKGSIEWNDSVPQGLFERVVCSFLSNANHLRGLKVLNVSNSTVLIKLRGIRVAIEFEEKNHFNVTVISKKESDVQLIFNVLHAVAVEIQSHKFFSTLEAEIEIGDAYLQEEDQLVGTKSTTKYDCFLSHCWGKDNKTHNEVLRIGKKLEESGLKVWIDENELKNNQMKSEMRDGIDNSSVFIAFLTKEYLKKSTSNNNYAGKEYNYAAKFYLDKIITVVLEPELTDTNKWVKSNVAFDIENIFVDYSSPAKEEESFKNLQSKIKTVISDQN